MISSVNIHHLRPKFGSRKVMFSKNTIPESIVGPQHPDSLCYYKTTYLSRLKEKNNGKVIRSSDKTVN